MKPVSINANTVGSNFLSRTSEGNQNSPTAVLRYTSHSPENVGFLLTNIESAKYTGISIFCPNRSLFNSPKAKT
ncbi:MAG: hypothetical protein ABSB40_01545 [Nitrososphaeria archaeon]